MDSVLTSFVEKCPVAVMARLGLEQTFSHEWVDKTFETHREAQYTRELLFSTVVDLMSMVALGLRPSLNAAAQKSDELNVSLAALYDKVNRTETQVGIGKRTKIGKIETSVVYEQVVEIPKEDGKTGFERPCHRSKLARKYPPPKRSQGLDSREGVILRYPVFIFILERRWRFTN